MTALTIKTNNQPRNLMYLCDFSPSDQDKIRKQYDWMEPEDIECNYGFFKYRGCFYHLQDFLRVSDDATGDLDGWDGYIGDSYFSGTVIKFFEDDYESFIVGRYFC